MCPAIPAPQSCRRIALLIAPAQPVKPALLAGLLAGAALAAVAWTLSAHASENDGSNYAPGFYGDFSMAVTQEPGWYLDNFAFYSLAVDPNLTSHYLLDMPGITYATDSKIAGGVYSFSVYPGAVYASNNYTTKGEPKKASTRAGAGDIYVVPAQLSWQWGNVYLLAFEGISIPVSYYQSNRDLNTGVNHFTFDSNVAVTWQPDEGSYDFSLNVGHMANTENTATHYTSGDEIHIDYSAGYYLTDAFGIGLAGSYYRQITPDSGRGVMGGVLQGEASSAGPFLSYTLKLGEREITVSTKWLHEYNVNNRTPADYIIFRTGLQF